MLDGSTAKDEVSRYMVKLGSWLRDEGCIDAESDETATKYVYFQLHATEDLRPLIRVYSIIKDGDVDEEHFFTDVDQAVSKYNSLLL